MKKDIEEKSKTRIKKEAEALQDLGMELLKLPVQHLERMKLPDDLHKALIDARSITSNVAGKRQRQFIGALMRDVDPEPIRQALLQTGTNLPVEPETVKETRMWMERLLTNDAAGLEEFISACPELEHQRLKQLLRNIKKETAAGKSFKSLKSLEQLIMKYMTGNH
jgi:ribosome-associated protein